MSTYWNFDKPVYENKRYVAEFVKKFEGDCSNYASTNISNYDTITSLPSEYFNADYSNANINGFFKGMAKCRTFPSINNCTSLSYLFENTGITIVPNIVTSGISRINIFNNCPNLLIAEFDKIKSSGSSFVNDCYMFASNCQNLESVITFMDTAKCWKFTQCFKNDIKLTEVCKIDTSYASSLDEMFYGTGIKGLDWEIDLSRATNINNMLGNCNNLLDKGITFINVPKTLSLTNIGCASSKYTVKNNIDAPIS